MEGIKCVFPACKVVMTVGLAWVPELKVLRRTASGPMTVKTLTENAHCQEHARVGRRQGLRFFSYQSTVLELNRRQAARITARDHFSRYSR